MEVEYRDCPGFPGYRVGDDGSVWSRWRSGGHLVPEWNRLSPCKDQDGYPRYSIRLAGKTYYRFGHRLVLEAFVGPRPAGLECLHENGDRTDNSLINLRWGTKKENGQDKVKHGNSLYGERSKNSKLKESDVLEIRRLSANGMSYRQIAALKGVSYALVGSIVVGKSWKHVK